MSWSDGDTSSGPDGDDCGDAAGAEAGAVELGSSAKSSEGLSEGLGSVDESGGSGEAASDWIGSSPVGESLFESVPFAVPFTRPSASSRLWLSLDWDLASSDSPSTGGMLSE